MNKLFILFFTLLLSGPAWAVEYWYSAPNVTWDTTAELVAKKWVMMQYGSTYSLVSLVPEGTAGTRWRIQAKTGTAAPFLTSGYVTRNGDGCTAPKVLNAAGTACEEPPPPPDPNCKAEKIGKVSFWDNGAKDSSAIPKSYRGCAITIDEFIHCYTITSGPDTGKGYCDFVVSQTGGERQTTNSGPQEKTTSSEGETKKSSDQTSPPMPPTTQGKCPVGTVQAGVDSRGTPICIGKGSGPSDPKVAPPKVETSKTTTNADNSTTVTKTVTTTNSDNSTTTVITQTTTMPDGQVTTSQTASTSQTPSGGAGRTDSLPEQEKQDMCKQNPMLAVCQNSTVSGSCREISCTGDAIQCATLRAAAALECTAREDAEALKVLPSTTLGQSILSGGDPKASEIQTLLKGTEVDMSRPNLDQSGFLSGGSCFGTKTFSVMGHSVSMDFAAACENIQPLRYAILAIAFFAAYMIVARSVLSS